MTALSPAARAGAAVSDVEELVIRPPEARVPLNLRAVWEHRSTIYLLVWRDLKLRYKQTFAGILWVLLQPLLTMLLFTLLFSRVAQIPTGTIPYPLFAYCGLVLWNFVSHALTKSTNSLVENHELVCKVYLPRLVLPISAVLAGMADFLLACVFLMVLMLVYGAAPAPAVVLVPLIVGMSVATTLGLGLWLAALNVRYRDVTNALPFALQVLLFATPIAYPSSVIPSAWQPLYALNPLVGVFESFRWALLGGEPPSSLLVAISMLVALVILTSGLHFFRIREAKFADII